MAHTRTSSKANPAERRSAQGAPASEAVEDYVKAIYALADRVDGPGQHERALRAAGRRPVVGDRHVPAARRDGARDATSRYRGVELTQAGERLALEVIRHHRLIEALPRRGARHALGPGPRRGRGPGALHLGGARAADRRAPRRPRARPARRSDPHARTSTCAADRTDPAVRARARSRGPLRPRLRLRPADAPLSGRAPHPPGGAITVLGVGAVRRAASGSTSTAPSTRSAPSSPPRCGSTLEEPA